METLTKATIWVVEIDSLYGVVWAFDNVNDAEKMKDDDRVIIRRWIDLVAYCSEYDIHPSEFIYCN